MSKKEEAQITEEKPKGKKETKAKPAENTEKVVEAIKEEVKEDQFSGWKPKTSVGKKVKEGKITNFDDILDNGMIVNESEIVEILLPDIETDLLLIGQAKGKFGGGQRRVFKQTQKKTKEGNKPKFATYAVAGNGDGFVGVGYGKSRETVPAREKSFRNAKLNLIKIRRGCGSWECGCRQPHSIPFKITGKCGSAEITLMPAPRGTGLVIEKECAKLMKKAGIEDVWSKTKGQTKTKINLINACMDALKNLMATKVKAGDYETLGIVEGPFSTEETQ